MAHRVQTNRSRGLFYAVALMARRVGLERIVRIRNSLRRRRRVWWRFLRGLCSEQQIYVRRGEQMHFFRLRPLHQIGFVGLGLFLAGWTAYSSLSLFYYKEIHTLQEGRMIALQSAHEDHLLTSQEAKEELTLKLVLARDRFESVTQELENSHKRLVRILGKSGELNDALEEMRNAARAVHSQAGEINRKKTNDKSSRLIFPTLQEETVVLHSRAPSRGGGAFKAEEDDPIGFSAVAVGAHLHGVLAGTNSPAVNKVVARLQRINQEQKIVLDHLDQEIRHMMDDYNQILDLAGSFDTEKISSRIARAARLDQTRFADAQEDPTALGGPFLPLAEQKGAGCVTGQGCIVRASAPARPESAETERDNPQITGQARRVNAMIRQMEKTRALIENLPLMPPIHPYILTSGFGPRIDPFTRKWAFHSGIDLSGSPIVFASLKGRVTYAGPNVGYGNLIEIDHGHGIVTRYGHLKEISVASGARVAYGDQVGLMGSEGRSTGEHLHYEILIDGHSLDPRRFLEAGKHVFQAKSD